MVCMPSFGVPVQCPRLGYLLKEKATLWVPRIYGHVQFWCQVSQAGQCFSLWPFSSQNIKSPTYPASPICPHRDGGWPGNCSLHHMFGQDSHFPPCCHSLSLLLLLLLHWDSNLGLHMQDRSSGIKFQHLSVALNVSILQAKTRKLVRLNGILMAAADGQPQILCLVSFLLKSPPCQSRFSHLWPICSFQNQYALGQS